jgi:leucyl aminopeptidase
MKLIAQQSPLAEVHADWLIVPMWEDEPFSGAVAELNERLDGVLTRLRKAGDISGKAKDIAILLERPGLSAKRLLVVGLGPRGKVDRAALVDAAAAASRRITKAKYERVAMAIPENLLGLGWESFAEMAGIGLQQGAQGPGLHKNEPDRFAPEKFILVAPADAPEKEVKEGAHRADAVGRGVSLARELVNMPPSDLYPETFADRAKDVADKHKIKCTIWDEKKLQSENMGSLLAVARGSERPPRLVILRYHHGDGPTLGLVGKGVTFDSGGLSLKTTEQMVDMKCDMAGAAAVLGAMQAIAELHVPANVLGILALVENMPSGKAVKLGDVLKARNGKTIEVLNTDAEGRLILADALAYAVEQKVDNLVDLATLTGACMVALGPEVAGLMSNSDEWSHDVLSAARHVGEKAWPLPMFPHYREMIKSDVADIKNTGGSRYAGAISAAKFLEEFVGETPWVHLDIAGPAWAEKESAVRSSGGTGCFVRTLVELAREYTE